MNYIKEINAFNDYLLLNKLSTGEIALWYALMAINNKTGWLKEFTVSNLVLQQLTSLSRSNLDAKRNRLKQRGLIDYQAGTSNQAGKYKIFSFECNISDTEQDTRDYKEMTQEATRVGHKPSTLNKLNNSLVVVEEAATSEIDLGLKSIVDYFNNNIHMITPIEYEKMKDWLNDIESEAILFAIEEAVTQGKMSMGYIEGILKNYLKQGIKTRQAAEALKREWQDQKNKKAAERKKKQEKPFNAKTFNNFNGRSYDTKDLKQRLLAKSRGESNAGSHD